MNVLPQIQAASTPADELWFKDAIIYQLHVKAFADSNQDGIGDFAGLTERLDYLQDLGVTALWLLPFYPSPGRDDGYDIADYGTINPDFGTMKDFRRFMNEAHRRGLRVITELVINHTSDEHLWFKRARRSPAGSSARDWYVWSETDQKYLETRIIFTDTEKSNWAWDSEAGAYYWHRFFSHQPDLNFDNPRVVRAVIQVMKRWLDSGVDGFRLDAIPYLCERDGTINENLPETHAVIKNIRAELEAYASGKVLLAEANQWPEDVQAYFGDGDECHMAYHFPLMPRIYMAIAQEDRFPIADILRQTPDIPANCQWALFLRNHDELTLEMVTDAERDYLWSTYAADPRARINLGIRRRLAPLMENDRRKIELMNSLLMSLPGSPIIYYGDEIGMGDNIYVGDRNGVRTPMQWTPDRNAGFSRADPARLYLPLIMDPVYGYQAVNVEAQSRSLSSLLSWMKRLIAVRKSTKVFGRGSLSFIRPANRKVLAYIRRHEGETILCVANLSRSAQAAELDLSAWAGHRPLEMLGRTKFPTITEAPFTVTLAPYGFFWFQLSEGDDNTAEAHPPEMATIVVRDGWDDLLHGRSRQIFEREVLPLYLPARRWFGDKGSRRLDPRIGASIELTQGTPGLVWTVIDVEADRGSSRYALPLTIVWDRAEHAHQSPFVIGPVRRGSREGVLMDAIGSREFVAWFMTQLALAATVEEKNFSLRFRPSTAYAESGAAPAAEVQTISAEQSNTGVVVDGRYIVKFFRRLHPGKNPDTEISRFLTERTNFKNTPAFVGSAELVDDGKSFEIAIAQEFVGNQGDGWAVTSGYLDRFLEETKLLAPGGPERVDQHAGYLLRMQQLGKRTAELHVALASRDDDADFRPTPVTAEGMQRRAESLLQLVEKNFAELRQRAGSLPRSVSTLAEALAARRDQAIEAVRKMLQGDPKFFAARHHGDFHLGQVLIVADDVYIIDFEGEPERSLDERRRKAPVARDVAGIIRSLDYAAESALDRFPFASPEERLRLAVALDDWRQQAMEAFILAYRSAMSDSRLWPQDAERAADLLRFFTLEKAIYEIGYELANRPTWLHVPLAGTWRLLFPEEGVPA